MGGPNLEVFKFGVYVFFPVLVYWHFGDPEWYERNVSPYKAKLYPAEKHNLPNFPKDKASVQETLHAEIAAARAAKGLDPVSAQPTTDAPAARKGWLSYIGL